MQPSALRALEFDRIVEAVKSFALTPMGADCLGRLQPSTDAQKVAQLLAATSETVRFVVAHGVFPLRAASDLPQTLAALAVEGRPLEARRGNTPWAVTNLTVSVVAASSCATFCGSVDGCSRPRRSAPIGVKAKPLTASTIRSNSRARRALGCMGGTVDSTVQMGTRGLGD